MTLVQDTDRQVGKISLKAQFLYNPPGRGLYCHSATLAQTRDGALLAAWYAYPEEEHRNGSLILARRRPGSATWSKSKQILPELDSSAGNPVLFEAPNGILWLHFALLKGDYWNSAELMASFSQDGGNTWSSPHRLWPDRGMMVRHPPVALEDGGLLLPAYDENLRESVLLKSGPPFTEWIASYRFKGLSLIQPVLVRQREHSLGIYFRPWSDPRQIWRSHSNDDGATWGPPVRTPLPNPLSGIAAFVHENRTVLIYNHTKEHQRHPLSLNISDDWGITWRGPVHIDTPLFEVSYPNFLLNPNGQVDGVYSYNRRMIKHVTFSPKELR